MAVVPGQLDDIGRLWEQVLENVLERVGSQPGVRHLVQADRTPRNQPRGCRTRSPKPVLRGLDPRTPSRDARGQPRRGAGRDARSCASRRARPTLSWPCRRCRGRLRDSAPAAEAPPRPARAWLDSQLNPRLTFETFVVGCEQPLHARRLPRGRRESRPGLQPAVHLRRLGARQDAPAARHRPRGARSAGRRRASTTSRPSASPTR